MSRCNRDNLITMTSLDRCHSRFVGWQVHCHPQSCLTCHSDPGSASSFSKHRAAVLLDWLDGIKVETMGRLRLLLITMDMKDTVY